MPESNDESGKTEEPVTDGTDWGAAVLESLEKNLADDKQDSEEESLVVEGTESEETDSETVEDSPEPLEPLEQWSDENKEYFLTLETQAQEFLLGRHKDMEGDYTQKTQELAEERKRYEALNPVLQPYEEIAKQRGVSIAPYMKQGLDIVAALYTNPAAAVKQAIQAYGLTPESLGIGVEDDLTDPTVKAQNERIANLEYRLTQQSDGARIEKQQDGQSEIDAFVKATNDDGSLKNPHFDAVRLHMAPLVDSGKTLDEAYKEAVYIVPEYREAQAKAASDLVEKEARESGEEKRKAKLKKAKSGETLAISDVETEDAGLPDIKNKSGNTDWGEAVRHTLTQMTQ